MIDKLTKKQEQQLIQFRKEIIAEFEIFLFLANMVKNQLLLRCKGIKFST